jgi:hypothetical protein
MSAVAEVDELIERYHRALGEFMKGNPEPAKRLWSHRDHALETQRHPDRRVLFRSGVPVTIPGGYGREALKLLARRGLRCARHQSSRLLKESCQPFGRDDEVDHGDFAGDVAPGVRCVGRHVDVIARSRFDPLVAPCFLP